MDILNALWVTKTNEGYRNSSLGITFDTWQIAERYAAMIGFSGVVLLEEVLK